MDDLISRQAAMTLPYLPKEYREYTTNNLDDAYEKGWDDCQECIKHIPADYTMWIPVSERLPEKNGHYLVTVESRADYSKKRFIAIEVKHSRGWMSDDNIIAWMPLPEPYKGEE